MAVILAGIELSAVQAVRAHEGRHLVRHHVPGLDGDLLQDLGRGPTVFRLDGLLTGAEAEATASELWTRFRAGESVELTAELGNAVEVTQVVIEDLRLGQAAGWSDLVRLEATLLEYVEPPQPLPLSRLAAPGSALAGLLGGIATEAGAWGDALGLALAVEGGARRIAADPLSAGAVLGAAAGHASGLGASILAGATQRIVSNPGGLGALLSGIPSGGVPQLTQAIGAALDANPAALGAALNAGAGSSLGAALEGISGGSLAAAVQTVAETVAGSDVATLVRSVSADAPKLEATIQGLAGDPAGAAVLASAALGDAGLLPDLLQSAPELLDSLDPGAVGSSLVGALETLPGDELGASLAAIASVDPSALNAAVEAVQSSGSLGELAQGLAAAGAEAVGGLAGLDLASTAVSAVVGGSDFLRALREVSAQAEALVTGLERFDPLGGLRSLLPRGTR